MLYAFYELSYAGILSKMVIQLEKIKKTLQRSRMSDMRVCVTQLDQVCGVNAKIKNVTTMNTMCLGP